MYQAIDRVTAVVLALVAALQHSRRLLCSDCEIAVNTEGLRISDISQKENEI